MEKQSGEREEKGLSLMNKHSLQSQGPKTGALLKLNVGSGSSQAQFREAQAQRGL